LRETTDADVDAIVQQAQSASAQLASLGREQRARLLEAIADSLLAKREVLVSTAADETGLGLPRLNGELDRSVFQFRLFAEAVREGGYLEAAIDHAGPTVLGMAPDVRRMLVPLGPVAVFGASNFPFAFSVAGGDTASALAAGCPVVVKAHSSHPLTSALSFAALADALRSTGAAAGAAGIVYGLDAGIALVAHPLIRAVGFTGSLAGGRALQAVIDKRDDPIPFYGELSSLNPLIVTRSAAIARAEVIARGLFASFTGSAGQLCTKPGLALVPSGPDGDRLVDEVRGLLRTSPAQPVLNRRILESYGAFIDRLLADGGHVDTQARWDGTEAGFAVSPTLITTTAAELDATATEECFGPLIVIARYDAADDLFRAIGRLPDSLTATIHCEDDSDIVTELATVLSRKSGRMVFNGFPTGVRVSWAQHHGGPWPATNSLHSSVGVSAMRRFLRPLAWQDAPSVLLPTELRDGATDIPRRVDGRLEIPAGR